MGALEQPVFGFILAMPRILAALLVLPMLNHEMLSGLARGALVGTLALIALPVVAAAVPPGGFTPAQTGAIVVKELLVGFLIGYLAAGFIWAVTAGGALIDIQRGVGALGGDQVSSEEESLPLARLMRLTVTMLFVLGGGLTVFLESLYASYLAWPVTDFYPRFGAASAAFFLEQLDVLMRLALVIAGPAILALFMADLATGLIARVMPQLNAFMLGLPVKSAIATLLLALYVALLIGFFREQMLAGLGSITAVQELLR